MRSHYWRNKLALTLVCALGSTLLFAAPRSASAQTGEPEKSGHEDQQEQKNDDIRVTAVAPEGNSLLLVSAGLLPLVGLGLWYRRRQRREA